MVDINNKKLSVWIDKANNRKSDLWMVNINNRKLSVWIDIANYRI
jgi:hypothetical protein